MVAALLFAGACQKSGPDAEALATSMKAKMKVPADVDPDTRLDDVRGLSKTELAYFLTLTKVTRATLDTDLGKRLETMLRGSACQNPNYITMMTAGITVVVVYRTADGADVARVAIAPRDCGH